MNIMTDKQASKLTYREHWFRYHMPYTFEHLTVRKYVLPGGKVAMLPLKNKHVYLPLNRDYKPLGFYGRRIWVDYNDYYKQAIVFSRDPKTFDGVWWNIQENGLFMYDDWQDSRKDYFQRF